MLPDLVEMSKRAAPGETPDERKARRERTQARIGLASNVVGLTAAGAATNSAAREFNNARRKAAGLPEKEAGTGRLARGLAHIKVKHAVGLAGAGLLLQATNTAGDVVANRVLARSAKKPSDVNKGIDMTIDDSHYADVYESGTGRGDGRGHSLQSVEKAMGLTPQQMLGTELVPEEISKRARRYDPEADRQRRMGLYAGLGAGGAALAGREAADKLSGSYDAKTRQVTVPRLKLKGKHLDPKALKAAKTARSGVGLAALAAASGAGGIAAYRHGVSRRNQPYN